MKPYALAILGLLLALPASAAGPVTFTPLASTQTTWTGQPYSVPQGPLQVIAQTVVIPAGGVLGSHKHPYPRFAYVQSGRLEVTNEDANLSQVFETGAFVVEAIDQWHHARALGGEPVKLLVIDQVPPGGGNMVRKDTP